jgi:hypothetical protein
MKINLEYFEYSISHHDGIIDASHPEGCVVASEDGDWATQLMADAKTLSEYITSYKVSLDIGNDRMGGLMIDRIFDILNESKSISYTPFCNYFQVLGYSYSAFRSSGASANDKKALLKDILKYYIENRYDIYDARDLKACLQVNADLSSSRRKGNAGINQLLGIVNGFDGRSFIHARAINSFTGNACSYMLPDKGDNRPFDAFLDGNDIEFAFRQSRDGKNPDMFLRIYDDYFIIEHKLTNGGGGLQNAEINEIINFIGYDECATPLSVHYASCLAGDYITAWNDEHIANRQSTQYGNIMTNLRRYGKNYFVNNRGMRELIKDYLEETNA